MSLTLEISESIFTSLFPLLPNHLNEHASIDWGDGFGSMFETYGKEWEFVYSQPVSHVWTLVDSDEGLLIVSGRAFVNRIGYFVSRTAVPDSVCLELALEA